ncbi:alpha/beta fold hydrolase [Aeromicrobium sp. Leaf350]|uniref:alpha/beta fold hydrolase n=1 Tax=Aeromicrobium sp. Leaf350 TaxID=2876565 RepID=UPI001E4BAC30|nr:alpha/beta hydrolase [Aeromicrobium sp. Leaf350]
MAEFTHDDVTFWFDEHGSGPSMVYLHGGFSDANEVDPVLERYAAVRHVYRPERRGHGRTADTSGPLGFEQNASDTIAFLEQVVGGPADLVGYSDGATTALIVALRRPDLVDRLVLMSGQFHHDGLLPDMFGDDPAAAAAGMVQSPLAGRYAEVSPDPADHFVVVVEKVLRMAMTQPTLTTDDLAAVRSRTLVLAGDDDVVAPEHSLDLYRSVPDAELAIVPGTSHVHIMDKPELVADLVLAFLTQDPVATRAPIRRAG